MNSVQLSPQRAPTFASMHACCRASMKSQSHIAKFAHPYLE